jgi:hypothetical protein
MGADAVDRFWVQLGLITLPEGHAEGIPKKAIVHHSNGQDCRSGLVMRNAPGVIAGSWDFGTCGNQSRNEIRTRLLSWFLNPRMGGDRDHFRLIVPYQSFARTSPPITASPMLSRVPMRKYSANLSFSSGNLAIDFPVRISPTIDGD